jgi:hypothetical protein
MSLPERVKTISKGVTSEVVSLMTTMFYDPASKGVTITFGARPCIFIGDQYQGPAGDVIPVVYNLSDIAAERLGSGTDPVTGADLTAISCVGAVEIIKEAFARLYDRQQAATPPPPIAPGTTEA